MWEEDEMKKIKTNRSFHSMGVQLEMDADVGRSYPFMDQTNLGKKTPGK